MFFRVGSIGNTAKSLDLIRQNLQKHINKEIDEVIQKYIKVGARPLITYNDCVCISQTPPSACLCILSTDTASTISVKKNCLFLQCKFVVHAD